MPLSKASAAMGKGMRLMALHAAVGELDADDEGAINLTHKHMTSHTQTKNKKSST
jgi:hypothetical protein